MRAEQRNEDVDITSSRGHEVRDSPSHGYPDVLGGEVLAPFPDRRRADLARLCLEDRRDGRVVLSEHEYRARLHDASLLRSDQLS